MEDKDYMENELILIKNICDLYMHGALESTTAEVHKAFEEALEKSLNIQNKIYNLMAEKGWYKTEIVDQSKIDSVKQKFENCKCDNCKCN